MAYEGNCSDSAKVTGTSQICVDWGTEEYFWRVSSSFGGIDTEANAKLEATWQALIQSKDVYPFPMINGLTNSDSEPTNEELANGMQEVNRGKVIIDYAFFSNPYIQKQLLSHNGLKSSIYLVDEDGNVRGIQGDDDEFLPIPVQLFQVQKATRNDGSSVAYKTMIKVVISDVQTYEEKVAIISADELDFDAKAITGLQPVTLTQVGDATATSITVKATISGTTTTLEGVFSDTVGEDWELTDADGATQAFTDITDNGDGTYTFTFATLVTGYAVSLSDPTDMETEGYSADNSITGTF